MEDSGTVTYSASCMPPKELLTQNSGDKRIQKFDIRFPTFLGKSKGFVNLNKSWKPIIPHNKPKTSNNEATLTIQSEMDFMDKFLKEYSSTQNTSRRFDRSESSLGAHDIRKSAKIKDSYSCERMKGLPLTFNPRKNEKMNNCLKIKRSSSFSINDEPKIYYESINNNFIDDCNNNFKNNKTKHLSRKFSEKNIHKDENINCNAKEKCSTNPKEEFIELFFELPNGTRQRIHMRQRAVFKHAIRAITARMGYRSINDLVFLRTKKKSNRSSSVNICDNTDDNNAIFINDTPLSIGMKPGEVIIVTNVEY